MAYEWIEPRSTILELIQERIEQMDMSATQPVQLMYNCSTMCDHCGEGHDTTRCPIVDYEEEPQFQYEYYGDDEENRSDPYWDAYNQGWSHQPDFSRNGDERTSEPTTGDLILQYMQRTDTVNDEMTAALMSSQAQLDQIQKAINNLSHRILSNEIETYPLNDPIEQHDEVTVRTEFEVVEDPNTVELRGFQTSVEDEEKEMEFSEPILERRIPSEESLSLPEVEVTSTPTNPSVAYSEEIVKDALVEVDTKSEKESFGPGQQVCPVSSSFELSPTKLKERETRPRLGLKAPQSLIQHGLSFERVGIG